MDVRDALARRVAVRAFRPDPVPEAVVRDILAAAALAPSGGNLQPWRVHALAGDALRRFTDLVAARFAAGQVEAAAHDVYPPDLHEPYRSRRREAGRARYAALGGAGPAPDLLAELTRRNYRFFGAPVGLFFCLDRRFGPPQWTDLGLYLQSVMLMAASRGLDTCPQAVWANWPRTIADYLGLAPEMTIVAGMALGHRDEADPLCLAPTTRVGTDAFASFQGFEESE